MKRYARGNRHDRRDAARAGTRLRDADRGRGAGPARAGLSGGATGPTGVSGATRRHRRDRRDGGDRPGPELPQLAVRGRQRDDRHAGQGRQVQRAADDPAQRHDRRLDDRAEPADGGQIAFFDKNEGGPSEAGIAILKQTKGLGYQLVAQSPLVQLQPYFGETAQFALATTIPVQKGERVALTVPTWAPALAIAARPERVLAREPPEEHLHERRRGLDADGADDRRLGRAVLLPLPDGAAALLGDADLDALDRPVPAGWERAAGSAGRGETGCRDARGRA